MTDTSTEAVARLLSGVSSGPWVAHTEGDDSPEIYAGDSNIADVWEMFAGVSSDGARANASFIAAARELVPALAAERDALRAALATARADALREAVAACKRIRAKAENDDVERGALEAAIAILDILNTEAAE